MASQPAIHILPNILQSKGNQTMKFGQLIECKVKNALLQISCRKWGRGTSSEPLFAEKSFAWVKSKGSAV